MSDLFPHAAGIADDLCVVRSMVGEQPLHGQQNLLLHTGRVTGGHPSFGAWVSYGLGTEADNLPGYVVLNNDWVPNGGLENFGSAFLPAVHQATSLRAKGVPVDNIRPADAGALQRRKLALLREQDAAFAGQSGDRGRDRVGHPELRDGVPHADGRPGGGRREPGERRRPATATASTPGPTTSATTPCSACGPGGWSRRGCGSSRSPAR